MVKQKRRIYFIEKKFQTQFIIKFCLLVVLGSFVTVSLLYLLTSKTTTVSFENTRAVVKTTADFIVPLVTETVVVVTVLVALATIMLTLFISHKIAGPLYRFKKELKLIESGDLVSAFKIRDKDQLQDLATVLSSMKDNLKGHISAIKSEIDSLQDLIAEFAGDEEKQKAIKEKIRKIKSNLSHFKT